MQTNEPCATYERSIGNATTDGVGAAVTMYGTATRSTVKANIERRLTVNSL